MMKKHVVPTPLSGIRVGRRRRYKININVYETAMTREHVFITKTSTHYLDLNPGPLVS
jgi:hypothetical protein